jgi:hypothetical protein
MLNWVPETLNMHDKVTEKNLFLVSIVQKVAGVLTTTF